MAGKRGGAKSTSWRDDDAVGDGENTADGDELDELVEHQKHPSFRGHPGSMQSTPRDDTRRNMRALRKSKDPEVGVSEEPVSQVDPVVMRKIQGDLDKLARRNRERERRIRCLLATVLCLEVNRGLPRLPHALAVQIARTAFAPLRAPAGATVDLTAE